MAASSILMLAAMFLINYSTAGLLGQIANVSTSILGDVGKVVDGTQTAGVTTVSNQCVILNRPAQEPDVTKLTIDFITRNSYEVFNINSAAEEITKSRFFNPNQSLVTFVHGLIDNPNSTNYRNLSDQLLAQGPTNIVVLNASALNGSLCLCAATYVPYIGNVLADMLYNMYQGGLKVASMYMIGHSLGAHISGYAARLIGKQIKFRIGRVTALDSGGPAFNGLSSFLKLDRFDADFVDTINSKGRSFEPDEDVGQSNFSPNGGSAQLPYRLEDCNHGRAVEFFTESIQYPDNFIGVACNSWRDFTQGNCNYSNTAVMGYKASTASEGHYYLQTKSSSPFGRGQEGIKYSLGALEGLDPNSTNIILLNT